MLQMTDEEEKKVVKKWHKLPIRPKTCQTQKMAKSKKKMTKSANKCKKGGFQCVGATIQPRWESQCHPYAGF